MDKEVWVDFTGEAQKDYVVLKQEVDSEKNKGKEQSFNMQLLRSVERAIEQIKLDPQYGIPIPRKYVSKALFDKWGTNRLWKIDLVGYWRMIYTLTGDNVKIIALVLAFVDHKIYNKLFGYRKR